ncbi:MAG: phosphotransferase [Alphaproteobacteria bacterium]|nr:phosphotransferase [Alphaproteobacteria bacterium]
MEPLSLEALSARLIDAFPELAGKPFRLLTEGWDSVAVDVDDALIFKFPRHAAGAEGLRREARLLAVVRPAVTMPLPDLKLVERDGLLFSRHVKLKGEHLLASHYDRLPDAARARLAADMALFLSEVHRIEARAIRTAGAGRIGAWAPPAEVARDLEPVLPVHLRGYAARTIDAWLALPSDPLGDTYGYFDGHGWNMAFDHRAQRLNGLYDLADSGFGPLQREFVYPGFIARDLTWRIIDVYERLTARSIDRRRVDTMTGYLRLVELAGVANDPAKRPAIAAHLERWASGL